MDVSQIKRLWSRAFPKKREVALDLESLGMSLALHCCSCGVGFTLVLPRGNDGYLESSKLCNATCHKCNVRDIKFCACDRCVRKRDWKFRACHRCGLDHKDREINWKCDTCGAVLCASQIALIGGFSERSVHVVFPRDGSPVIEFGAADEPLHTAYSICGDAVRLPEVCPDCYLHDGGECEKHSHRVSSKSAIAKMFETLRPSGRVSHVE